MTVRTSFFFLTLILAVRLSAQQVTAASLQQLLDEDRYIDFSEQLGHAQNLTAEQQLYFLGVLAYRVGRLDDATKPLIAAVNTKNTSLTSTQVEEALQTLGEDAMRQSQYGSAAQMYDTIDKAFGAHMADGGKNIRDHRHLAVLLQHVPAQTITFSGDFTLARSGSEYPVSIGGKAFAAQLDSGAAISVLSASTARAWGVTLLEGTATMHGYGGGAFPAQPGYISVLTIGKAEVHNVAVYVTQDENLYIAPIKLQINALLGYPVIAALGRLTFAKDGSLTVSAKSPEPNPRTDAHLWFADSTLLVQLNTQPVMANGKMVNAAGPRLFVLDTGSGSTYLTDHYLAEHTDLYHGPPPETAKLTGGGGTHEIPAYGARNLPLFFGSTMIFLNGPHILTESQGSEIENYFGLIGQDVLGLAASYTIDLRNMAFRVQP